MPFVQSIRQYIPVSPALEEELRNEFVLKTLYKNELFIREGQCNASLAFLAKGMMRCFSTRNGKEITNGFILENVFVTDFQSLKAGAPAQTNYDALEDCQVYVISNQRLLALASRYPELQEMGNKLIESLYANLLRKTVLLKSDTPKERYLRIVEEKPVLLQRVPLHYIASYLGITQVHLSRIRKDISH